MLLRDLPERNERADAGIREQYIESPAPFTNRRKHSIEVGEIGDVTLDSDHSGSDLAHRRVELLLAAAGYINRRALRHEPFAAASPRPPLPPVTSAIFPASLLMRRLLCLGFSVPLGTEYRYGRNEASEILY